MMFILIDIKKHLSFYENLLLLKGHFAWVFDFFKSQNLEF